MSVGLGTLTWPVIGCGRFFEGNGAEMHKALNETLASLPDETRVFVSPAESPTSMFLDNTVSDLYPNEARSRIHQVQRKVLHVSIAKRGRQGSPSFCGEAPRDAGQVHHW